MKDDSARADQYVPPVLTDLGTHVSFVQALRLSINSDGVVLPGNVIGTRSPV